MPNSIAADNQKFNLARLFKDLGVVPTLLLSAVFCWIVVVGALQLDPPNSEAFALFDVYFMITTTLVLFQRRLDRTSLMIVSVCAIYLLVDALAFQFLERDTSIGFDSKGALYDFIYSDKYIAYIIMIGVFCRKRLFGPQFFTTLIYMLLVAMSCKYGILRLLSINDRPKLVVENNYEVVWLQIIFVIYSANKSRTTGRVPTAIFAWLCVIVALSGSRSATLAMLPIAAFLFIRANLYGLFACLIALPAGCVLAFNLILSRGDDVSKIDRVKFFDVFWNELSRFEWYNFIIGLKPLTPLTSAACRQLIYYASLFSSQENGRCYSLILHSFFMRAFFDHGALGVIVPFIFIYALLRRCNFSNREASCLVALGAICGLSVSGIGTSFVAFPLALAMGWRAPSVVLAADRSDAILDPQSSSSY